MNAILLIIPLIFIRYGLLGYLNKTALARAALFPETLGNERIALIIYQLSNILFIIYLLFLKVKFNYPYNTIGIILYVLGIVICIISTINFAKADKDGMNTNGLYSFSRNPMYIAYFFYYLGCVFLTQSLILFILLLLFQISAHWLILSEERWCIKKFDIKYKNYMEKVRRYL